MQGMNLIVDFLGQGFDVPDQALKEVISTIWPETHVSFSKLLNDVLLGASFGPKLGVCTANPIDFGAPQLYEKGAKEEGHASSVSKHESYRKT